MRLQMKSTTIAPRVAAINPAPWSGEYQPTAWPIKVARKAPMMPSAVVIRACPDGLLRVPQRPAIVIPRPARTLHRIEAGDHVLLAAAPAYDLVIVHTLSALDDMLASYHSTHATGIPAP